MSGAVTEEELFGIVDDCYFHNKDVNEQDVISKLEEMYEGHNLGKSVKTAIRKQLSAIPAMCEKYTLKNEHHTSKQIDNWRSYKEPTKSNEWFRFISSANCPAIAAVTIAEASRRRTEIGSPEEASDHKLYYWSFRYESPVADGKLKTFTDVASFFGHIDHEDEEDDDAPTQHSLPKGICYDLHIKAFANNKYVRWITVRASNRAGGGNGVFAARRFLKYDPIGIYMGPVIYRGDRAGSGWHVKDNTSVYAIDGYDPDCYPVVIDPTGLSATGSVGYMGMHLCNSATKTFRKGTSEYDKARRQSNVWVDEDFTVYATKEIKEGNEILLAYAPDEIPAEESKEDDKDLFSADYHPTNSSRTFVQ